MSNGENIMGQAAEAAPATSGKRHKFNYVEALKENRTALCIRCPQKEILPEPNWAPAYSPMHYDQ